MPINWDEGLESVVQETTSIEVILGKEQITEEVNVTVMLPDIKVAKAEFLVKFKPPVDKMLETAKEHEVADSASKKLAVDYVASARKMKKAINDTKLKITEDARSFSTAINNMVKPLMELLGEIDGTLSRKVAVFTRIEEQKRREAEAAAAKALAEMQRKLDAEAKAANVKAVQLPSPVIPKETVTRTGSGSTSRVVTKPVWEIEDFSEVSDKYKMPNKAAIDRAVKDGLKNIAGIRIWEEETVKIITGRSMGELGKF